MGSRRQLDDSAPLSAKLSMRRSDDETVEVKLRDATAVFLESAVPWRTFRWYRGQPHYSGHYWSVTESGHVIYESRLELARLLYADFDRAVEHIIAQPFLLRFEPCGHHHRHVPDYLLFTSSGLVVVDVKPAVRLDDPQVAATLTWVRRVAEDVGWQYEVFTEPPPTELANVRFLAGYRRREGISAEALTDLRSRDLDGVAVGQAVRDGHGPAPLVRAALLHMLWRQELNVDLGQPLSARTVMTAAAS
jgi:hypothetical protein